LIRIPESVRMNLFASALMNDSSCSKNEILVLVFSDTARALDVQTGFQELHQESFLTLKDSIVVTRDETGKVKVHEAEHILTGGAVVGVLVGALVGVAFMIPGLSAVGAGLGAIVGALAKLGVEERFTTELGATIVPGSSALFLLGRDVQLDEVSARLGPLLKDCKILRTTISAEREEEVREILEMN